MCAAQLGQPTQPRRWCTLPSPPWISSCARPTTAVICGRQMHRQRQFTTSSRSGRSKIRERSICPMSQKRVLLPTFYKRNANTKQILTTKSLKQRKVRRIRPRLAKSVWWESISRQASPTGDQNQELRVALKSRKLQLKRQLLMTNKSEERVC